MAPRLSSLITQADRLRKSCLLWGPENTTHVILAKAGSYFPKRLQYITEANRCKKQTIFTIAVVC